MIMRKYKEHGKITKFKNEFITKDNTLNNNDSQSVSEIK